MSRQAIFRDDAVRRRAARVGRSGAATLSRYERIGRRIAVT